MLHSSWCYLISCCFFFSTPSFIHLHRSIVRKHIIFGLYKWSVFHLYFKALNASILDRLDDGWMYSLSWSESKRFIISGYMSISSLRTAFSLFRFFEWLALLNINFIFEPLKCLAILIVLWLSKFRNDIFSSNKFDHKLIEFLDGISVFDELVMWSSW